MMQEYDHDASGQLFNLAKNPGETTNLFFKEAKKRKELQALLQQLKRKRTQGPQSHKAHRN